MHVIILITYYYKRVGRFPSRSRPRDDRGIRFCFHPNQAHATLNHIASPWQRAVRSCCRCRHGSTWERQQQVFVLKTDMKWHRIYCRNERESALPNESLRETPRVLLNRALAWEELKFSPLLVKMGNGGAVRAKERRFKECLQKWKPLAMNQVKASRICIPGSRV